MHGLHYPVPAPALMVYDPCDPGARDRESAGHARSGIRSPGYTGIPARGRPGARGGPGLPGPPAGRWFPLRLPRRRVLPHVRSPRWPLPGMCRYRHQGRRRTGPIQAVPSPRSAGGPPRDNRGCIARIPCILSRQSGLSFVSFWYTTMDMFVVPRARTPYSPARRRECSGSSISAPTA